MSAARRRRKAAERANRFKVAHPPICTNCGIPGRHFAVPSLGDPGFFICDELVSA